MRNLYRSTSLTQMSRAEDQRRTLRFLAFCGKHHLSPTSPSSTLRYLKSRTSEAGSDVILADARSIRRWYVDNERRDPFERKKAQVQLDEIASKARPVRNIPIYGVSDIHRVVDAMPHTATGARDTAMFLLAYVARVSLYALPHVQQNDIVISSAGLYLRLRAQRNRIVTCARAADTRYCVVAAVERWLTYRGDGDPVFCTVRWRARPMTRTGIQWSLNTAVKRAGYTTAMGTRSLHGTMIKVASERGAGQMAIRLQHGFRQMVSVDSWQSRLGVDRPEMTAYLGL